jgi:uronate dehydrogenase
MTISTAKPCKLHRLLLTGAAGGVGRVMRTRLRPFADVLRVSDIASLGAPQGPHEEVVPCDLTDKAAVRALLSGCDAVIHLGGVSIERPFEEIFEANLRGLFHVYEAARHEGVRRIVFASSNHVIGFYKQTERLDLFTKRRPDGNYGVSKAFGEDLAQMYFDRHGIETVSVRIGSALPEPTNRRQMNTWLSYRDMMALVEASLFTPNVGHTIVYGASANGSRWWDNSAASHLNYVPQDDSEIYRAKIEALPPEAADDPNAIYQGGFFTTEGPFD